MESSPPERPASGLGGAASMLRRSLLGPEASVLLVIALLSIFLAVRGDLGRFIAPTNQDNLLRSISMQSIFAIGELLVILTGGIDLSVGSLIAFDGMLLARLLTTWAEAGMPEPQATLLAGAAVLAFSLGLGLVHASLIHFLRLPAFVVTLASMSILRSAAQLLNNAVPIPINNPWITFLGNKKLFISGTEFGVPVSALVLGLIASVIGLILLRTQIGRRVYAVGSNEEAARLSGVNVYGVRCFVYGGCSLLTGISAILYTGYGGQGDPLSGTMFELNGISAAVIGGAVLTGGQGSVLGTILGAVLLEWILNIINITDITPGSPTLWRGIIVGVVLLGAVILNYLRLRRIKAR